MNSNLKLNEYYDDAKEWGYDRYQSAIVQRNRAYVVAAMALIVALVAVLAVAGLTPLKEKTPWLIERSELGQLEVVTKVDASNFESEKLEDLSHVETYFRLRERFDPKTFEEDNVRVQFMSSEEMMGQYVSFIMNDPMSPYISIGKKGHREFYRRSIISLDENRYQIRYTTTDVIEGDRKKPKHWIAVLTFTYSESNVPEAEEDKFYNIVGFMVTGYKREQEIIYEG